MRDSTEFRKTTAVPQKNYHKSPSLLSIATSISTDLSDSYIRSNEDMSVINEDMNNLTIKSEKDDINSFNSSKEMSQTQVRCGTQDISFNNKKSQDFLFNGFGRNSKHLIPPDFSSGVTDTNSEESDIQEPGEALNSHKAIWRRANTLSEEINIVQNFKTEQNIFNHAIIELLYEKRRRSSSYNREGNIILKSGRLHKRKRSQNGRWSSKHAIITMGLMIYEDDENRFVAAEMMRKLFARRSSSRSLVQNDKASNVSDDDMSYLLQESNQIETPLRNQPRKRSLPLIANKCTCRPVKTRGSQQFTDDSSFSSSMSCPKLCHDQIFMFELTVENGPRRFWITESREERQSWIDAIHKAMLFHVDYPIKSSEKREEKYYLMNDSFLMSSSFFLSPFRSDIEYCIHLQRDLYNVNANKEKFLRVLKSNEFYGKTIILPYEWIDRMVDVMNFDTGTATPPDEFKPHNLVDFQDVSLPQHIDIEGFVLGKNANVANVIGSLTNLLLKIQNSVKRARKKKLGQNYAILKTRAIQESEAISMAWEIFNSIIDEEGQSERFDSFITKLLIKSDAVSCVRKVQSKRTHIKFSAVKKKLILPRKYESGSQNQVRSGWIAISTKATKPWKRLFCILYEDGTFKYFEKEKPTPHGLRGIANLYNARLAKSQSNSGNFIVAFATCDNSKKVKLWFQYKESFDNWTKDLEIAIAGSPTNEKIMIRHFDPNQEESDNDTIEDHPLHSYCPNCVNIEISELYKISIMDQDYFRHDTWIVLEVKEQQNFHFQHKKLIREEFVEIRVGQNSHLWNTNINESIPQTRHKQQHDEKFGSSFSSKQEESYKQCINHGQSPNNQTPTHEVQPYFHNEEAEFNVPAQILTHTHGKFKPRDKENITNKNDLIAESDTLKAEKSSLVCSDSNQESIEKKDSIRIKDNENIPSDVYLYASSIFELQQYIAYLHSPDFFDVVNNVFERQNANIAKELQSYYLSRPSLKYSTLEKEIFCHRYIVYPDNTGLSLTDAFDIQDRYFSPIQGNSIDDGIEEEDMVWRAANLSLVDVALSAIFQIKPNIVRKDLMIKVTIQACRFVLCLGSLNEGRNIQCMCDLLIFIPNTSTILGTMKLNIKFVPSVIQDTPKYYCFATNINPYSFPQKEINDLAMKVTDEFLSEQEIIPQNMLLTMYSSLNDFISSLDQVPSTSVLFPLSTVKKSFGFVVERHLWVYIALIDFFHPMQELGRKMFSFLIYLCEWWYENGTRIEPQFFFNSNEYQKLFQS